MRREHFRNQLNAAVSPKSPSKERQGCLSADMATWRDVFELNFFTPLLIVRGLAPALALGKGSVVNITSIAGHSIHPFAGSPYSTSKAALSALTRELAAEMAELGVRAQSGRHEYERPSHRPHWLSTRRATPKS